MHDSHAHLTQQPLKDRVVDHIKEFKDNGGKYILNASFNIESINEVIEQSITFEKIFPKTVFTAIGIHPIDIFLYEGNKKRKKLSNDLNCLAETLKNHRKRIYCIGETGLDYHYIANIGFDEKEETMELQKISFKKHCELALAENLPMTIHCRDVEGSTNAVIDALKILCEVGHGTIRGCFHSFTGEQEGLKEILNHGFYVGFNGIVTYPKAENVRELLYNTPLERILIETDCPDLPPQRIRSNKKAEIKYCTPRNADEIYEKISEVKEIKLDKLIEKANENFECLFLSN
ncbi:TatD family hydrolase [Candidatus Dojkabacteria bacterium]|jgi:TatD DNase family protein|nr:TatD family hydrolase [Candidatus Dojkabacteria bacterium]